MAPERLATKPTFVEKSAEFFDTQEGDTEFEATWAEFIDKSGSSGGLLNLWLDTRVKNSYRIRALTILMHPQPDELPYPTRRADESAGDAYFPDFQETVSSFEPEVSTKRFAREFALALYAGIEVAQSIPGSEGAHIRDALNQRIPTLLPYVSKEAAHALLDRFSLTDEVMQEGSGYHPLEAVYTSMDIDAAYKKLLAERMRERILAEQSGAAQPRTEREAAALQYALILDQTYRALPRDFLKQEVLFLLQNTAVAVFPHHRAFGLNLFGRREPKDQLMRIQAREISELHSAVLIAWRLYGKGDQKINGDHEAQAIKELIQDIEGKQDYDGLGAMLTMMLRAYEATQTEDARQRTEREQRTQSLHRRMRR